MLRWVRVQWLVLVVICLAVLGTGSPLVPVRAAAKTVPKIAYIFYDSQKKVDTLFIADASGKNAVALLTGAFFFSPVWSPDGTQLAFSGAAKQGGSTNWEVYLIGSDGSNLHKVSTRTGKEYPGYVTWAPDGTQLIYGVRNYGQILGFYRINADGTGEERLGFGPIMFYDGWISWSPDGKQVAVVAQAVNKPYYQLYLSDPDGNNARPLVITKSGKPANFNYLVWAPDGKHIFPYAQQYIVSDPSEIDVADLDGSNAKTILGKSPTIPNNMSSLSVSPDGKQILFIANEPNVDTKPTLALWVANANGSGLHALGLRSLYAGGTSWGMVPEDLVPKGVPITLPTPGN